MNNLPDCGRDLDGEGGVGELFAAVQDAEESHGERFACTGGTPDYADALLIAGGAGLASFCWLR